MSEDTQAAIQALWPATADAPSAAPMPAPSGQAVQSPAQIAPAPEQAPENAESPSRPEAALWPDLASPDAADGQPLVKISDVVSIRAPEGYEINPDVASQFLAPLVSKFNLNAAATQALVDAHAQHAHALVQESWEQTYADHNQLKRAWLDETNADPEITKAGRELVFGEAKQMLKDFGTPQLRKDLDDWGLSYNADLIKLLSKAQRAISSARAETEALKVSLMEENLRRLLR